MRSDIVPGGVFVEFWLLSSHVPGNEPSAQPAPVAPPAATAVPLFAGSGAIPGTCRPYRRVECHVGAVGCPWRSL